MLVVISTVNTHSNFNVEKGVARTIQLEIHSKRVSKVADKIPNLFFHIALSYNIRRLISPTACCPRDLSFHSLKILHVRYCFYRICSCDLLRIPIRNLSCPRPNIGQTQRAISVGSLTLLMVMIELLQWNYFQNVGARNTSSFLYSLVHRDINPIHLQLISLHLGDVICRSGQDSAKRKDVDGRFIISDATGDLARYGAFVKDKSLLQMNAGRWE